MVHILSPEATNPDGAMVFNEGQRHVYLRELDDEIIYITPRQRKFSYQRDPSTLPVAKAPPGLGRDDRTGFNEE
jgi:hypothetical protein